MQNLYFTEVKLPLVFLRNYNVQFEHKFLPINENIKLQTASVCTFKNKKGTFFFIIN